MTTINIEQVREELCHFLRLSDVLSTTVRGVTRQVGSYVVAGGGEATHSFASYIPARNFKSLTVDAVNKYFLRDYTMNWTTGILTWNSALVAGQTVNYSLDWGTGDKIYPDYPRDDLNLTSYPRVGLQLVSVRTEPFGLGGGAHLSDFLFSFIVLVPVNKDTAIAGGFGGLADLEETHRLIREAVRVSAKTFFTFSWITPSGLGPVIPGTNGKVMLQSADYNIRFRVE